MFCKNDKCGILLLNLEFRLPLTKNFWFPHTQSLPAYMFQVNIYLEMLGIWGNYSFRSFEVNKQANCSHYNFLVAQQITKITILERMLEMSETGKIL